MVTASETITDTDRYPVFANKVDFMTAFEQAINQHGNSRVKHYEILYRLSNTDTDVWADPTDRHDD